MKSQDLCTRAQVHPSRRLRALVRLLPYVLATILGLVFGLTAVLAWPQSTVPPGDRGCGGVGAAQLLASTRPIPLGCSALDVVSHPESF